MKAQEEDQLAARLGAALRATGKTIACAESCTGGLVTSRLTDIPGSSGYVMGSIVSYTNEIKERLVGVRHATLAAHGAVSPETAREMAEGIRRVIRTDLGIGITGIAGPGGGTAAKPVGLVYIAVDTAGFSFCRELHLTGDRAGIREQAADAVFQLILDTI